MSCPSFAFCRRPVVTKNSPLPAFAALMSGSSMMPTLIWLRSRGLFIALISGTITRFQTLRLRRIDLCLGGPLRSLRARRRTWLRATSRLRTT